MANRARTLLRTWRQRLAGRPAVPTILMYHRVAEPAVDPWLLAVNPTQFERQMRWLRRHRTPMPLGELVRRVAAGTVPDNAVAVTFDDGYLDNLIAAKPVLVRHGIPATLFVATGLIGNEAEFWWDELARLVVAGCNGTEGWARVGAELFRFPPPEPDPLAEADGRFSPAGRRRYQQLWAALRSAPAPAIEAGISELRRYFHAGQRGALDRAMTEAELRAWLEGGVTEIAAHTVTHRPMTVLAAKECQDEIEASIARCNEIAGQPTTGFAYPYGDRNEVVAAALSRAGVGYACSTRDAGISPLSSPDFYDLPRIQAMNGPIAMQWKQ